MNKSKCALIIFGVSFFSVIIGFFSASYFKIYEDQIEFKVVKSGDKYLLENSEHKKLLDIKKDIKGFNTITIYNKHETIAFIRYMENGNDGVMSAHVVLESKKNGKERIDIVNPDYVE